MKSWVRHWRRLQKSNSPCCIIFTSRLICNAYAQRGVCYCPLMSVCLSVYLASVLSKRLNGSSWFSVQRLSSTYPTVRCTGIRVSPKIMVLPFETLSAFRNFQLSQIFCFFDTAIFCIFNAACRPLQVLST